MTLYSGTTPPRESANPGDSGDQDRSLRALIASFVKRLIGTLRREMLDPVFFWDANDLARKLEGSCQYYSAHRVHTSLDGDTPSDITGETNSRCAGLNHFQWKSHCRGPYQLPVAA
ncbi:MAG: integrase core domain-containing protein [Sedimenticolaceae bacterium]